MFFTKNPSAIRVFAGKSIPLEKYFKTTRARDRTRFGAQRTQLSSTRRRHEEVGAPSNLQRVIGVWWISYEGTGGEMDAVVHPHCEWSGGAEAVLALEPNSSISIAYDSLFGPHDDLMLLELDEKLLPEVMHERVTLRGQPDDDVVLCTSSKTYGVKFVGTSNSMFLIPSSDKKDVDESNAVAHVVKLAPGCMELTEVAPKLDELKLLLSQNPYGYGEESEMDILCERERTEKGLYKWADLVDRLRASDEEIKLGLQSLSAVEIDGYWRILNEEYMNGILNMLLHNIILNDWSVDALDEGDVVGVLERDGFPRNVAKHCLRMFCSMGGGEGRWKLEKRAVCAGVAREILREGKMRMEVFVERWSRKLPEGMNAGFEVLQGEVLTEKLGVETWVYWFSKSCLPSEPADRFAVLFRERQKWEWKDLEPYVRDLRVPGLSSEGLLLKYTRRSQPSMGAEPIFSAR
ncbi:zinc ion binding [Striga hermonthica]|uniref:Zinc ion binding n=1 Tax=Striga hermonthica TaxID=68872 RepID=A0A9N7RDN8_STRHE|nr:zinc ion binding [Striga hermonthica]